MDRETMRRMSQKIIGSLPEDSPVRLYLKGDGSDIDLIAILMALLFTPGEELSRIAKETMEEADG